MVKNLDRKMHMIVQLASGQGIEQGGWRWPAEDKAAFINEDIFIKGAQLAEKGKLDGFFLTDIPGQTIDLNDQPPQSSLDPIVLMSLMAKATERVGLITTMSTSVNEPYSIARALRSIDLISKGRMGWNVVTTGTPKALLNYFNGLPGSDWKHGRSLEVWESVVQLWGSWPEGALKMDVVSGHFADNDKIAPIDYKGKYISTRALSTCHLHLRECLLYLQQAADTTALILPRPKLMPCTTTLLHWSMPKVSGRKCPLRSAVREETQTILRSLMA